MNTCPTYTNDQKALFGGDRDYAIGSYVAFDDGELIANAPSFNELSAKLAEQGRDRPDVFVIQVAEFYPEKVFILLQSR